MPIATWVYLMALHIIEGGDDEIESFIDTVRAFYYTEDGADKAPRETFNEVWTAAKIRRELEEVKRGALVAVGFHERINKAAEIVETILGG